MSTIALVPPEQRVNPWMGNGFDASGCKSAGEALRKAGLDWEVQKEPLYIAGENGRGRVEVPDKFAIVRQDRRELIGVVGGDYRPWQNAQALQFADDLVEGGAKLECVGEARGGKWIYALLALGEEAQIAGADPVGLHLIVQTSHDGTKSITAAVGMFRIRCTNAIQATLRKARSRWTVRHTADVEGRLKEAQASLGLAHEYCEQYTELMSRLAGEKFSSARFDRLAAEVIGEGRPKVLEGLRELYRESPTLDGIRDTKWGALNAVSEYFEWGKPHEPHAQLMSIWTAQGARARDKALSLLAEAA